MSELEEMISEIYSVPEFRGINKQLHELLLENFYAGHVANQYLESKNQVLVFTEYEVCINNCKYKMVNCMFYHMQPAIDALFNLNRFGTWTTNSKFIPLKQNSFYTRIIFFAMKEY